MLTNSPNRKSLLQVSSFLEGKSESYRVWAVLLRHWIELNDLGAGRRVHAAHIQLASPIVTTRLLVGREASVALELRVAKAGVGRAPVVDVIDPASPLAGASEAGVGAAAAAAGAAEEDEMHGGDAEAEADLAGKLRDAMMEAVAAPLTPRIE